MIGSLDSQVIEKFQEFQQKSGEYLDLDIGNVEFENIALSDERYFGLNPKKSEIDVSLRNANIEVSFVPLESINEKKGVMDASRGRKILDVYKGYRYFKENDVIFTKVTPSMENGNFAIAKNLINGIGFGSSEYHIFRCKNFLPELLWLLFRANYFRNKAKKTMRGSGGLKRVPIEFFDTEYIPIPKDYNEKYKSIDIQKAIVEFLEFWKINYTDVFRQTVTHQKPILEKIKKALIPATLRYDKTMVNSFNEYIKTKGIYINLSEIEFQEKNIDKIVDISRGQVISKKDLKQNGQYPVYSSQTKNEGLFGFIDSYMYDGDAITWTTDGKHAGTTFLRSGKFNYTNVCGLMTIKKEQDVNIHYLSYMTNLIFPKYVDRTSQNSKLMAHHLDDITIPIPYNSRVDSFEIQKNLVEFWEMILNNIDEKFIKFNNIKKLTDKIDEAFLYRTFSKIEWREE